MQLLDVQRRYTRVGEIRLGERITKGGKSYPSKLSTFRLTSKSLEILKAAAERYGGSVEKWEEGDGYQVITDATALDIMLPPVAPGVSTYSLHYELWKAGGLQRRCDGENAMVAQGEALVESGCQCDPDRRECKPTLRLGVFLPEVAGFGTWKLSSTGYNAAAELPGMLDLLAQLSTANRPIRATLRLEQRSAKKGGKTHNFAVPVIDLPYSMAELTAGQLPVLEGNGHAPQLTSSTAQAPSIEPEAPPIPSTPPRPVAAATEAPSDSGEADNLPLDDVLTGPTLERWRAGTHAAMRARIPDGEDEHAALRDLADTALEGLGDRSLNDLTYREWMHVARALRDLPVIEQPPQVTTDPGAPDSQADGSAPAAATEAAGGLATPAASTDAPPSEAAAEPATFADSPPAKVSPAPPDPERIEQAVYQAALEHKLIEGTDANADWRVIDAKATEANGSAPPVLIDNTPEELAAHAAYWTPFAAAVAAGVHDPAPRRPRKVTA